MLTITGLTPGKAYQWQIRAKCGKNWTTFSMAQQFGMGSSSLLFETDVAATKEQIPEEGGLSLQVTASPNPATAYFRIIVHSNNPQAPIKIIVTDMLGRLIENRTASPGREIIIGETYKTGMYMVRAIQGERVRLLRVVKMTK